MARSKRCLVCSSEFTPKPVHYLRSKYCSSKCYGLASIRIEDRKCINCSKSYKFQPSQLNRYKNAGKYCSRPCAYEKRVKLNASKPTTDAWGRTRRKADVVWQTAVRERDGCICQRCGIYDKYIHTHHRATRSQRPDLKHDVDNGVCLCNSCHTWVHKNPKISYKQGWLIKNGSN